MTHKAAPPETPDQAACREHWSTRLGHTAVGWGRDKTGKFLAEFARNAQVAWTAAREQGETIAKALHPAPAETSPTDPFYVDPEAAIGSEDVRQTFGRARRPWKQVDELRQAAQAVADAIDMGELPTDQERSALNNALAPFTTIPTRGPTA